MKILTNAPVEHQDKSEAEEEEAKEETKEEMFIPQAEVENEQQHYDKIVNKLLDYNEKINHGREIQVIEYLKRLKSDENFMHQFKNQRHLRRAFFTEFKIHCFNYKLLLFESVIRILTTLYKDMEDNDGNDIEGRKGRRQRNGKNEE